MKSGGKVNRVPWLFMTAQNSTFPEKYRTLVDQLAEKNGISFEAQLEMLAAEALEHCGIVKDMVPETIFLEFRPVGLETINIPYFDCYSHSRTKPGRPPRTKFVEVPVWLKRDRPLFGFQIEADPKWGVRGDDILVIEDSLTIDEGDVVLVETRMKSSYSDYIHEEMRIQFRTIEPDDLITFDHSQTLGRGQTKKRILGKVLGLLRQTTVFPRV